MSLLLLFRPHAGDGGPGPEPEPEVVATGAGRKRKHSKVLVEIDGREFWVDSLSEAIALLAKAEKLALVQAERQIEQKVQEALPKAILVGKAEPVRFKEPWFAGSPELRDELNRAQVKIRKIYKDAAIAAELRILMALEEEQSDEEVVILLMS